MKNTEKQKAINFFPFSKIRKQQKIAIEKIEEAINNKKKFIVLEMPTGGGKSPLAMAFLKLLGSGYILTSQKTLQSQYMKDFSNILTEIKGRGNYICQKNKHLNCSSGMCKLIIKSVEKKNLACIDCTYKVAKTDAINATHTLMNYDYFLSETTYVKQFEPRNLIIFDEAHNIEAFLMKFITVEISELTLREFNINGFVKINASFEECCDFLEDICKSLNKQVKQRKNNLNDPVFIDSLNPNTYKSYMDDMEEIKNIIKKITGFFGVAEYTHFCYEVTKIQNKSGSYHKLIFKPLDIKEYAKKYLFDMANTFIFMSATICGFKEFCKSLGIKVTDEEVEFIQVKSTFPIENRPIYIDVVGKMSYNSINETLPKLVIKIKEILKKHKNDKGIIHTSSYQIANYIENNINDKRLLFHDSYTRHEILDLHLTSKEPTVLVSPSMSEGLDLCDDLSRFQIICKIPYPSLGDKQIKERMTYDPIWYQWLTVVKFCQMIGRSVRNEKDHADTYVLDSNWGMFYGNSKRLIPEWIKEAIIVNGK